MNGRSLLLLLPDRAHDMKNQGFALFALALTALAVTSTPVSAQGLDFLQRIGTDVDIKGLSQEWNPETQVATVTGEVRIGYDDVVIKANRAEYYTLTGDIIASDDVTVYQDGRIYKGDKINFNTKTGNISSDGLRTRAGAVLFRSDNFRTKTKDVEVIEGGETMFTTHDSKWPNYHIKAKEIKIYPDDKIVFKSPKIYAGNTPIFWLPSLTQPLDDELGYFFVPGYNSRWGGFLLNRYGVMYGDHTLAQYHVDLRSGRGVGLGVDLLSEKFRDNPNIGQLTLYSTYDLDPQYDREGIERSMLDNNRYRVNFQHRIYLPGPEESTLYLDFDVNKLSDRLYYSDFFFSDAQFDPQPDNIINLVKREEEFEFSLLARFQLNDFFGRDTRSPEIAIDFATQEILDTGAYYRGSTSYGIIGNVLGTQGKIAKEIERNQRGTEIGNAFMALPPGTFPFPAPIPFLQDQINRLEAIIDGTTFNRFYSYHEALYPADIGAVRVVPRVGLGMVSYTEIDNGTSADNFRRPMVSFGLDVSTKWTKEFPEIQSRRLGLNKLRHIIQPYMNYSYLDIDEDFGSVLTPTDANLPTTKLRPIDVPLFSNVDSLNPWNIVRTGVRHTFQTQRGERTHNWLMFNTYIDSYLEDPEFNRDTSGIHTNIEWRPLPWVALLVDSQFPISDNPANFTELNSQVIWSPTDRINIGMSHFMLQDHPTFNDSSLLSLSTYFRLSESWGFSSVHRFEAEDSTLEMQGYTLHRDLTTWTASFGALIVKNEGVEDQVGVVLSFTLKDFPSVYVPLDLNPNPTYR